MYTRLFLSVCVVSSGLTLPALSADVRNDSNDEGRIIGGRRTNIEDHPYQVSVRYKGRHICGGSIIDKKWILTAAHCMRRHPEYYAVKTSSTTLTGIGKVYEVKDVILHENYDTDSPDYDIAVIELESPLTYDEQTGSVSLASSDDRYRAGTMATVTGWGVWDTDDNSVSNYLREVEVPLVSASKCLKLYDYRLITSRMICAGYVNKGGKDACSGDSGGPLVLDGKQIGIVSWGFGCARPSHPGVYARVSSFRTWVEDKTGV